VCVGVVLWEKKGLENARSLGDTGGLRHKRGLKRWRTAKLEGKHRRLETFQLDFGLGDSRRGVLDGYLVTRGRVLLMLNARI
jgi:hypothetical protein